MPYSPPTTDRNWIECCLETLSMTGCQPSVLAECKSGLEHVYKPQTKVKSAPLTTPTDSNYPFIQLSLPSLLEFTKCPRTVAVWLEPRPSDVNR